MRYPSRLECCLNNYMYQSFHFHDKRKLKPFYDLVAIIYGERSGTCGSGHQCDQFVHEGATMLFKGIRKPPGHTCIGYSKNRIRGREVCDFITENNCRCVFWMKRVLESSGGGANRSDTDAFTQAGAVDCSSAARVGTGVRVRQYLRPAFYKDVLDGHNSFESHSPQIGVFYLNCPSASVQTLAIGMGRFFVY